MLTISRIYIYINQHKCQMSWYLLLIFIKVARCIQNSFNNIILQILFSFFFIIILFIFICNANFFFCHFSSTEKIIRKFCRMYFVVFQKFSLEFFFFFLFIQHNFCIFIFFCFLYFQVFYCV